MNLQVHGHFPPENVREINGDAGKGPYCRAGKGVNLPLKKEVLRECSKKVKKNIDDFVAFLSLAKTSADASRYSGAVKAAGLTNRQSRLLQLERGGWPSH